MTHERQRARVVSVQNKCCGAHVQHGLATPFVPACVLRRVLAARCFSFLRGQADFGVVFVVKSDDQITTAVEDAVLASHELSYPTEDDGGCVRRGVGARVYCCGRHGVCCRVRRPLLWLTALFPVSYSRT